MNDEQINKWIWISPWKGRWTLKWEFFEMVLPCGLQGRFSERWRDKGLLRGDSLGWSALWFLYFWSSSHREQCEEIRKEKEKQEEWGILLIKAIILFVRRNKFPFTFPCFLFSFSPLRQWSIQKFSFLYFWRRWNRREKVE